MQAAFESAAGDPPERTDGTYGTDGVLAGQALLDARAGRLLDLIRIATFVLDPEGRIAVWSPAAVELTGRPVQEMLDSDVAALFADEARERAGELFRRASAHGGWV